MFGLFQSKTPSTNREKATLKVLDMHCTSCAMNIDMTLEELAGVHKAVTHYATATTVIEFDPQQVDIAVIKEQITNLGYTTEQMTS